MTEFVIPPEFGIPIVTGAVLAFVGYLVQLGLKRRPPAPTIPEMWKRLDELEARLKAAEEARRADQRRMTEMERHVSLLEAMVPPPPPPRPWMAGG